MGAAAPEIQARLLDDGGTFALSTKRGKTVIVNFWATWCAPCREEMPVLQAYYQQHQADGLEILAISMDDSSALAQVRAIARKYGFPVAWKGDASFAGLGRIWRLPTTFVIDSTGLLRRNGQTGDAEITRAELDSLVTPLLGQ